MIGPKYKLFDASCESCEYLYVESGSDVEDGAVCSWRFCQCKSPHNVDNADTRFNTPCKVPEWCPYRIDLLIQELVQKRVTIKTKRSKLNDRSKTL